MKRDVDWGIVVFGLLVFVFMLGVLPLIILVLKGAL